MNLEIKIEKLVFGGDGLGFVDGKACFVAGAVPGEKVLARVSNDKPNYCKASLLRVLEPAPERIIPPCPYVERCGGCQYQHLPYAEELRWKENQVRESFQQAFREHCPPIEPIQRGANDYTYRTSITLHRTQQKGHKPQRLGFIGRDNRSVILIDRCLLADETLKNVFTAEHMLTKNEEKRVFKAGEGGRVYTSENEKLYRVIVGEIPFWTDSLGFFQNNLGVTDLIGRKLGEWVREIQPARFLDLYSGVGTFSLLAAPEVQEIHCFEENPYSMTCVEKNFKALGVTLAGIHPGKVEKRFPHFMVHNHKERTLIFLDPPRQGIASSLAEFLAKEEVAENIAFLACDLPILIRDLRLLLTQGRYAIRTVIPFDMFPRTKHIEILCWLQKI
ncbi:MAG TPA: RsmD family RNA methyltransferase [Candidatus Omnitrophota bacterium]|nr:RsmD family RNA methyltransferase [Candidatus Omnitrophota bacterium]HPS36275.1 RsmD family RNA methyltransferase [Candidatus Omnitrophota bacterium]